MTEQIDGGHGAFALNVAVNRVRWHCLCNQSEEGVLSARTCTVASRCRSRRVAHVQSGHVARSRKDFDVLLTVFPTSLQIFGGITTMIEEFGGDVVKYVGDAVIAAW